MKWRKTWTAGRERGIGKTEKKGGMDRQYRMEDWKETMEKSGKEWAEWLDGGDGGWKGKKEWEETWRGGMERWNGETKCKEEMGRRNGKGK